MLETGRLTLRHLTQGDAPFVLELLTDPAFRANIGDRGVHDLPSALHYIATGPGASYAQHGFGLNVIELKGTSEPLGMCGLLRRDTHPDVEIGFALLPKGRGRGIAREAAAGTLAWGFRTLNLKRIVAITAPENRDSIRILENVGLKYEGIVHLTGDGRPSKYFVLEQSTPN
ncbi:MAG: GNAT family N-acetyltransferase [Proteobacteria bacterium]|nr:GNAT family N-acetyltransferase [Pseudomonadota bacterium]